MPCFIWHMAYEIWHMKNDRTLAHSPTRLNILSKLSGLVCLFFIVMACLLSSSCSKTTPRPRLEEKPLPPATVPTANTAAVMSAPELPAAKPAEVEQAIERVFKGAVTIQTGRTPYFAVGDFNGDFSQDLAVAVRPVRSKLVEINDELAPWILVNPVQTARPVPEGSLFRVACRNGEAEASCHR